MFLGKATYLFSSQEYLNRLFFLVVCELLSSEFPLQQVTSNKELEEINVPFNWNWKLMKPVVNDMYTFDSISQNHQLPLGRAVARVMFLAQI